MATSRLDVVLFCPGPSTVFRPQRDASQWWNRRDAVVRCVAAFLCGPGGHCGPAAQRSLILWFDDDGGRIDVTTVAHPSSTTTDPLFAPTEYNVLYLLQQAVAQGTATAGGLTATLVWGSPHSASNTTITTNNKRALLQQIQATCDLEFLRRHGLNSSPAVVLKKTNQARLAAVWKAWQEQQTQAKQSSNNHNKKTDLRDRLTEILTQPQLATQVALLHESGRNELPVWQSCCYAESGHDATTTNPQRTVLLLGAVRDMTRIETAALVRAATGRVVRVRLGRVPEFTSKILTMVAWHTNQGVLEPALQALLEQQVSTKRPCPKNDDDDDDDDNSQPMKESNQQHLHVLCRVGLPSTAVGTDLQGRTPLLWNLVRCSVVTLWRSKVHSTSSSNNTKSNHHPNPLRNHLHLVFADGVSLSLSPNDIVADLASQHQAAPTEFQILQALVRRLSALSKDSGNEASTVTRQLVQRIYDETSLRTKNHNPLRVVVLEKEMGRSLIQDFYRSTAVHPTQSGLTCLVCLNLDTNDRDTKPCNWEAFLPASSTPIIRLAMGTELDAMAATLTLLQHVAYQNRWRSTLLPKSECLSDTRKKDPKKKKKHRKDRST